MNALKPVSFQKERAHEPRISAPYVPGKRHERYWTEEEIAILRSRYGAVGPSGCVPFLPRHSLAKIYAKANALGLRAPAAPLERKPAEFTPEMDARIRDAFPTLTRRGAVAALAVELDVRRHQLSRRMAELGLTMPRLKEPNWTDAEVALMRRVPLHDPKKASRIFREHGFSRSATSITVKAKRLNLSRRTHETLSAHAAARILGVDEKFVTTRCIDGRLKAGRRGTERRIQQGGDVWTIEPAELRRFILDHLGHIDIRKVDKFAFVELLVGDREASAEAAV
ncbi:hypothetical protein ABID82_005007 [Methylobacterium sp. PvP062]|uniref:Uncharacterized protein n=1 Tax=Methylobacterium radiotolerans TaxID=31998 RepID=A0ABV2NP34_9HYPH|nr:MULTISPECIES: hypothetical protein [unclassified Methylobacterium]MBP2495008.1 hypothetical protein [Methylobacterium sp. PvP105]MBP2505121.1 hypothetical protein [Methylobacterium sp. PvP109]MCX7331357.1 hypothetical protein [Hyphomicrobiales bacterium]